MTSERIAFFCRAKPQGADIVDICIENKRCFIGYPLFKNNVKSNSRNLKACLVNPTCDDEEWKNSLKYKERTNEFNKNRNFIRRVTEGSICVIPRPERGLVYISMIKGNFEICDDPEWLDDYLLHRERKKLDVVHVASHAADVSQSWKTEPYRKVSLARVPGWLRKSMFGRSTYGTFRDHPLVHDARKAVSILEELYNSSEGKEVKFTKDINEIKSRLVDNLNANSFEHLVVSLLQLSFPKEVWHQTGGSGDGGIDGFGCDTRGNMTGLMQAKYSSDEIPVLDYLAESKDVRRYAAILISNRPLKSTTKTKLLDIDWVAIKLLEHCEKIPLALTLRIGNP